MTFSPHFLPRVAAALLVSGMLSSLIVCPASAQQKDVAASVSALTPEMKARATLRSETRIRHLHDRLKISPPQEALWEPVAQAMRSNAAVLSDTLRSHRKDAADMTAVNDLKTFQIIADEHAAGLKKFIPAFEALYNSMDSAQKGRADHVFSERQRFRDM